MSNYLTTIGMEFHAELKTKTKIFCACPTDFSSEPNTNICPICLGLPGVLPVLNHNAVRLAVKAGLALNCSINHFSNFDRKNYFYPDLPKAYQVSQLNNPICGSGWIMIKDAEGNDKKIRINHIHLEEDAGKLIHSGESISDSDYSLPDYNRGAVPLIEIVTEPDMSSAEEAKNFGEKLRLILEYAGVSDVKMEQGSLRCDVNISIRPPEQKELGTKVEIKNLNSFRSVYRAVCYEELRQKSMLDNNLPIVQETRLWDDISSETRSMRSKEDAHDYRYFPEPDLVPIILEEDWVQEIASELPQLPDAKLEQLINDIGLSEYDAGQIVASPSLAKFFDEIYRESNDAKAAANWILGDISRLMNSSGKEYSKVPLDAKEVGLMICEVKKGAINHNSAQAVLEELFDSDKKATDIIAAKGFAQISDTSLLDSAVTKVIAANPQPVQDYQSGKKAAIGFLVGQVMKETKGQANPAMVKELLEKALD
jgi:aspartyl-tRNA(Asn)/glutamyl-tRNA(Gln) amidotransferase subunit B